jgi:hypothetical protein
MSRALDRWLAAAEADADRRGLPDLKPLLQGLASSTAALRAASWNERADSDGVSTTDDAPGAASPGGRPAPPEARRS